MTVKIKLEIPKEILEDMVKTNYDKVLEVLQKHKDGLTTNEISVISGVYERRVGESLKRMKQKKILKEKMCRCNRTPIYYL